MADKDKLAKYRTEIQQVSSYLPLSLVLRMLRSMQPEWSRGSVFSCRTCVVSRKASACSDDPGVSSPSKSWHGYAPSSATKSRRFFALFLDFLIVAFHISSLDAHYYLRSLQNFGYPLYLPLLPPVVSSISHFTPAI
jgi:hypothetical protein